MPWKSSKGSDSQTEIHEKVLRVIPDTDFLVFSFMLTAKGALNYQLKAG